MQLHISKAKLKRELIAIGVLVIAGAALLPAVVWIVGSSLFGDYAAGGYLAFYGDLLARLASGSKVAWFLVLSPLLGILVVRLTLFAMRVSKRGVPASNARV